MLAWGRGAPLPLPVRPPQRLCVQTKTPGSAKRCGMEETRHRADAARVLCLGRTGTRSLRTRWLPAAKAAADREHPRRRSVGRAGRERGGRWAQLEGKHTGKHLSECLHRGRKDFLLVF